MNQLYLFYSISTLFSPFFLFFPLHGAQYRDIYFLTSVWTQLPLVLSAYLGGKQTPKFNIERYLIKKVWTFLPSMSSITLKYQLSKLVQKRKKSDKILK